MAQRCSFFTSHEYGWPYLCSSFGFTYEVCLINTLGNIIYPWFCVYHLQNMCVMLNTTFKWRLNFSYAPWLPILPRCRCRILSTQFPWLFRSFPYCCDLVRCHMHIFSPQFSTTLGSSFFSRPSKVWLLLPIPSFNKYGSIVAWWLKRNLVSPRVLHALILRHVVVIS